MYAKQAAITEAVTALKKAIGKTFTVTQDMLETPPKPEMGDVAFPCFEFAKGEGRNPAEIATELAAKIGPGTVFKKITSAGPYVNFHFADIPFAEQVLKEVSIGNERYGRSTSGKGKKILVEGAQPNTHKEFHIGHVRNATLSQSVANVLQANGYEVVFAAYIGDIGAHVAKALWGLKKFHDGEEFPKEERATKLGEIYTKTTQYVEKHEKAKEEIASVQRALEAQEEPWHSLWKETREWSLDAFKEIFKQLHVEPDVWYYESEVEGPGKELVKKMLTEGIAKKSEGATIVDLEDEGLGAFLILKSDGSSLYATKDLALAFQKQKDYDPDRQIFVVDVRQSHYFKQLFSTLRKMGFSGQLVHLAYDMVTLPEGTMSSRSGNVITYTQLRDAMVERLRKETAERHEDWSEKKIEEVAHTLAVSSIQFAMLRQDPETPITFDLEEAMSFDGYTAPYILYTIARIESIMRQTKVKPKPEAKILSHKTEFELIRQLADFPLVVQKVGKSLQISAIASWAFETAQLFSEYYHQVRVLDEEHEEAIPARLALIDAVKIGLENAMSLLSVETVDEM